MRKCSIIIGKVCHEVISRVKSNITSIKCTKNTEKNWMKSHNEQFLKKTVDFF